jgi:predicted O-methyltransferase YrrM
MITDERIAAFIDSFGPENPEWLDGLEKEAHETNVPIIRTQMQSLIRFLLTAHRPASILEVGCAIGFSALLMSEYMPDGAHITTIENYEKRIPAAKANFRKYGQEDRITLLEGDAEDILPSLKDRAYDFIFMDAAKGQYINFLPELKRLAADGAVILTDNVLQDGDVIESRYAVERRNRTIHTRMREYLYALTHDPELTTVILQAGDGAAVSVVNRRQ